MSRTRPPKAVRSILYIHWKLRYYPSNNPMNYLATNVTKKLDHNSSPMIGESGTSKTGKVHHYYKCSCRKRDHACDKKVEHKDWLEEFAVRYTVETVLTDENIDLIATKAMELIEKESADTSFLDGLRANLKDIEKKIGNIMRAIEDGIYSDTTKGRLAELEENKRDLEGQIAREEMKKPLLSKERIIYWLTSFKSGNLDDLDYRRRVIDTLLNSLYVFDNPDGGRKLVFTFNLSGQNTSTIECSDIKGSSPL